MSRPAKVRIDLKALRQNVEIVKRCAPQSNIVAVLKANAYGHGAIEVAEALRGNVTMFAVSSIEEAVQLRDANINDNILLLEGCFSAKELLTCEKLNFDLVIHSDKQLQELLNAKMTTPLKVWVKVDTGMHRLGMDQQQAEEAVNALLGHHNIKGEPILMTHMASSDLLQAEYTSNQIAQFMQLITQLQKQNIELETSVENSGTILGWPNIVSDWCRPGVMLYGLSPFSDEHALASKLTPVMTLESEIIALRTIDEGECVGYGSTWKATRPSLIATVAIGYGDGYPRNAKSGTPVLVNGQRACLAGRVSMDMLSIDVTDLNGVKIGDSVELWGQSLNANEVAYHADTIGYELVTRMPLRVPKHYAA